MQNVKKQIAVKGRQIPGDCMKSKKKKSNRFDERNQWPRQMMDLIPIVVVSRELLVWGIAHWEWLLECPPCAHFVLTLSILSFILIEFQNLRSIYYFSCFVLHLFNVHKPLRAAFGEMASMQV